MSYDSRSLRIVTYVMLTLLLVFSLVPVVVMFMTSFKEEKDIYGSTFKLLFSPTLQNYRDIFLRGPFLNYTLNSAIIAAGTTVITTVTGALCAYSMSRYRTLGLWFNVVILLIRAIPPVSYYVPVVRMFSALGMIDTYISVIIMHTAFNLPFAILMMVGFFDAVPKELEEAALVDGATKLGALFKVVLPVARGGLIATAIFVLITSWNEFPFAFVLTGAAAKTLPVAVLELQTEFGVRWGQVMALGSVTCLPVLIFALLTQKDLVRGLTMGAVKG